jgi:hypothetical protein
VLPRNLGCRSEVQRRIDRVFVGPTRPCSTFAVSGRVLQVFSFRRHTKVFTPSLLLSSTYPSPRSTTTYQLAPHAHAKPPLLRFLPLQRLTETGVRIPRRFQPPALSVLRVSHPLDVLLRLQPWPVYFTRPALLGFHQVRLLASIFRQGQGETRLGFLSEAFSLPVTTTSSAVSSHALVRCSGEGAHR